MADDQLKSKRPSAQPSDVTLSGSSSSLMRSMQAGLGHAQIDSQQPHLATNQQPIGPVYNNTQPPMRATASSAAAPLSSQRNDSISMSTGRNQIQEGYSRPFPGAAQYYPRVVPSAAAPFNHAPPNHSAGQPIPFAYNAAYAMTQTNPQQNLILPSYMAQLYSQSAQQHSLYPQGGTNMSAQNQWLDDQSGQSASLAHHHTELNASLAESRAQPYHGHDQLQAVASRVMYQRLRSDRPVEKLSLALIETYKKINEVYFEERQRRHDHTTAVVSHGSNSNYIAAQASLHHKRPSNRHHSMNQAQNVRGTGVNNNGWDDENFDYIVIEGEMIQDRYSIEERIGKGSFGQVVRAYDTLAGSMVAIKIIKSKKPFLIQAKTEIELLTLLGEKDPEGEQNIVRLLAHFIFRNHQCLVFEMLSLNLYDLLKNTQFAGVSLNLIRKFGRQILKALHFLGRSDVDIIHCDLKPENILLKHPKRSNVKVIDFGSSCKSNKRMYSYIQSRFYRSPEVILGLPYTTAIDMWSLGCILVEMYTGEPLFSGTDQFDQIQKIVKILGMIPDDMLNLARDDQKLQYFELIVLKDSSQVWCLKQREDRDPVIPSTCPLQSLSDAIGPEAAKKKRESTYPTGNTPENYQLFIDLISKMLSLRPDQRLKAQEALNHPFIADSQPGGLLLSGADSSQSSSTDDVKK